MTLSKTISPIPIEPVVDWSTDHNEHRPHVVQRIVTPHPVFPEASIETVWEVYNSASTAGSSSQRFDDDNMMNATTWMRIAVYSGPDTTPRTLHASFELPPDADPQQDMDDDENTSTTTSVTSPLLAWTTFPEQPAHPVLCVLVHPTSLSIWNVYPPNEPAEASTVEADSNATSLALPAEGWTISLPFECCAILPVQGRGLFLQRMQDAEDLRANNQEEEEDGFVLKAPPQISSSTSPRPPIPTGDDVASLTAAAVPSLFSLEHPLEDVLPVCELVGSNNGNDNDATKATPMDTSFATAPAPSSLGSPTGRPITDVYEKLVWMGRMEWVDPSAKYLDRKSHSQVLIVTYHTLQRRHAVWAIQQAPPPPHRTPLYQQTRLQERHSMTSHAVMLLLEDLDLWEFDTAPTTAAGEPASRDQALADALGVRRTPRKSVDHGTSLPMNRSRHRTTVAAATTTTTNEQPSFLSPMNRSSISPPTVDPVDPTAQSFSAGLVGSIQGPLSRLHASLALQCLYRETGTSEPADTVFLASNPQASGKVVLCLLCPTGSSTKSLKFWLLHPNSSTIQVTPRTVVTCNGAQPLQSGPVPLCFRPHPSDTAVYDPLTTDILVLHQHSLCLYRAWIPVADCGLGSEKVHKISDSVRDRITLTVLQKNKETRLIRGKVSLRLNNALAERVLTCLDSALVLEEPILALKIRADCRRLVSQGPTEAFSAVRAVVAQLMELEYGQLQDTCTQKATDSAWDRLLASEYHHFYAAVNGETLLNSPVSNTFSLQKESSKAELGRIRSLAVEYAKGQKIQGIASHFFDRLHLLYEDLKLSTTSCGNEDRNRLGRFLMQLCLLFPNQNDSSVQLFVKYYEHDLGESSTKQSQSSGGPQLKNLRLSSYRFPPSIYSWCETIMKEGASENDCFDQAAVSGVYRNTSAITSIWKTLFTADASKRDEATVEALLKEGFVDVSSFRESLPAGIALPVLDALSRCRINDSTVANSTNWSAAAWSLVGREDLSMNVAQQKFTDGFPSAMSTEYELDEKEFVDHDNDGLVPLERSSALLFPRDNRIHEAGRLLRSSRPMFLRVTRAVEVSDHDYEKLKQKKLLYLSRRAFALPVGRGMLTIGSLCPVPAEPMPIPELCLKGRLPPTNASISLDTSDCPADMRVWPEFHNGVAAGLRLPLSESPGSSMISRTWIVYNKPPNFDQNASDDGNEAANAEILFKNHSHGGLLMALGLRGHLNALSMSDLYGYLTQGAVTTTVGILLGMACNNRGSCDIAVSKMLCLHIPSLIPQHFSAIDVASTVQAAAVISTGLLFEGSSHRMMTEFLLSEIGRRPESDANAFDRVSYNLACGLALGMVNLCISEQAHGIDRAAGVADLRIEERLQKYVLGGIDSEEYGRTRESNDRFSLPATSNSGENEKSNTIFEGDFINTDVTAPGATLALGLMYMKTGNQTVASAIALPDTHFLLEFVRPDLLTLRIISRSLILWDEVQPTIEWIEGQIPAVVHKAYTQMGAIAKRASEGLSPLAKDRQELDFDRRAVRQIYVHTVAGACFGMGLRFAGTGDQDAKKTIEYFVLELYALRESKDPVATASKPELPILETCLGCAAISLAMVMAGTGDLDALRIFKMLRWRCDEEARYGFHMICGMAIGLLFLSGGSCTLGREPSDIAALVTAFFPRFPVKTSDNQNHLQPLRHLYALAVKRRELRAIDVDSGRSVRVPVELWSDDGEEPERVTVPCLLRNSERHRKELRVVSKECYPLKLSMSSVMDHGMVVFVKRRRCDGGRPLSQPKTSGIGGSLARLSSTIDLAKHEHPLVKLLVSTTGSNSTLCSLLDGLSIDLGEDVLSVLMSLCRRNRNSDVLWNLRLIRAYYVNQTKWNMQGPAVKKTRSLLAYLLESAERDLGERNDSTSLGFAFYSSS